MTHVESESIFDLIQNSKASLVDKLYGGNTSFSDTDKNAKITDTAIAGYNSQASWACKAIFQSLSSLAKHAVVRLLFMESHEFKENDYNIWVINSHWSIGQLHSSFIELKKLRILLANTYTDSLTLTKTSTLQIHPHFRRNLLNALSYPQQPWHIPQKPIPTASIITETTAVGVSSITMSPSQIDQFSDLKWENVLRFLVNAPLIPDSKISILYDSNSSNSNSSDTVSDVSNMADSARQQYLAQVEKYTTAAIRNFLKATGLLSFPPTSATAATSSGGVLSKGTITAKGYEYMLKDRLQQVWMFVSAMISRLPQQEEAISLLFILSFCELGQSYPIEALTSLQRKFIFELSYMGVVFIYSVKSKVFYPTRISIHLLSRRNSNSSVHTSVNDTSSSTSSAHANINNNEALAAVANLATGITSNGYLRKDFSVIVETNNQVVAYTSNDLDLAMLALFVDIQLRMPNMVYGKLTREKAKAAYKAGIKASQIIDFLISHAHPILLNNRNSSSGSGIGSGAISSSSGSTADSMIIPHNVADQLMVWEAENYRLHMQDAVVLNLSDLRGFTNAHFRQVSEYMKRLGDKDKDTKKGGDRGSVGGVVLWENEKLRLFAVTPQAVEVLQSYIAETLHL